MREAPLLRAAHFRGTPRSPTRGPRGASRQPTAAVRSPRPPGGEVGPAQLSGDRGWRPAAMEAGAGPFNRAAGQRVQEPLWRPPHTHLSPPHVSRGLSVPLLPQLHPPALPHPLCTAADEVTVGKVYAALMIFDFYKQSKSSRDQTHQAPGGLTQVPAPGSPHGPVPSAVRRPWERTPLPRRFGAGGRRRGPAGPRLRPHAPRCGPSAGARSCWGAPEAGCSCSEPGEGRAENSPG